MGLANDSANRQKAAEQRHDSTTETSFDGSALVKVFSIRSPHPPSSSLLFAALLHLLLGLGCKLPELDARLAAALRPADTWMLQPPHF